MPDDEALPQLPKDVLDQFAAIPLEVLLSLIEGMKNGTVQVGVQPFNDGDDIDAPINQQTFEQLDTPEARAAFLGWLEDELQRRRQ